MVSDQTLPYCMQMCIVIIKKLTCQDKDSLFFTASTSKNIPKLKVGCLTACREGKTSGHKVRPCFGDLMSSILQI
jgi:hypothetical protein